MDFRESGDSECESIGWATNLGGKVAEGQRHSDGNGDSEGAVSPENGHSDQSTFQTKSTIEVLHSDLHVGEAMSERINSVSSGSKARQREDRLLGICGERTSGRSSQVEERPRPLEVFPNSGRGGYQSPAGGGGLLHEGEEPLTSNGIHDNSPAKPGGGESENSNDGVNIHHIARSRSAPVDHTNGQKLPSNVLELAVRLSDSLGMAVATVFHEVFERNGDFGSSASPVDELSGLLGAALKESLFPVLGNERAIFLENFRNSFRSTYQTMRSVSRAYAKSEGRLIPPSRQPYPNSWRSAQSKPKRVSPSQFYLERTRKNLDETSNLGMRKLRVVGIGVMKKKNALARHPNYAVESKSEEETASFTPNRYGQQGQRGHSPCSSGKSCLNESLQSAFFTNSTHEPEGYSDTAGSCSKSCLNESLESSFFTSPNPERGGQDTSTRSCTVNSANESLESLLLVPTPDARDLHSEQLDTDDSSDVNMFSAASSTESDHLVKVDKDEVIASARSPNESGWAVTFDSWTSKKDHKHRRVVEYETNPSAMRRGVDPIQDTNAVGSSDSQGRFPSGDLMQHTKPIGSSDVLGTHVVGDSLRETKSVGSSDSPGNRNQNSLKPGTRILRNSSGRVHAHKLLDHPGDRLVNARSSQGASAEIGENSCVAGEPRMNLEHALRRGADLFGRPHVAEEANFENILVHRRPVWGDDTQLAGQLAGLSLEDTVLPPFLNYGVRANIRQTLLERYVEAQETQNHLKQLEIAHSMKLLLVKKDHLELQSESNMLMKENVDLGRSKIDLKEFELEDRKLTAAHRELSQTCADELVAGLCVMLVALAYSAWKFSYTRLSRVVTMCQLPPREPRHGGWLGTNWMANAIDAITWQMQALTCEVTKAGRMLAGLILIALITTSLLRRTVTSSSQTMPATIIIVVLAGICGFAGKISIDSLGGDGYLWLLFWETLCFLHAFATTCTPWLYKYLYGPSSKFYQAGTSSWMKLCSICARFSFHTFLVFAIPVMAGLLPFASIDELSGAFWEFWEADTIIDPY